MLAALLSVKPLWSKSRGPVVRFERYTSVVRDQRTNYQAVFVIHNPGTATAYYEGTPFPTYVIEHKVEQRWLPDAELPDAEVLASIFPNQHYRFSIPVPVATNEWRIALLSVAPSRAPLLLRRYFPPRKLVFRGPPLRLPPGEGPLPHEGGLVAGR